MKSQRGLVMSGIGGCVPAMLLRKNGGPGQSSQDGLRPIRLRFRADCGDTLNQKVEEMAMSVEGYQYYYDSKLAFCTRRISD